MVMRRFIAGAICPQCRAEDRLVLEAFEGGKRRRCVACGFTDTLQEGRVPEPSTRLTRRGSTSETAAPVRILDLPKPRK